MNKDRLQQIIAEYMPHRWAELIEPMAEAILDNLPDDKPKQKPEWEEKLIRVFDTLSPLEDLQVSGYVWANANKTYMTISNDGVLTFGDDVTPKEAARELAKWFNEFIKETNNE